MKASEIKNLSKDEMQETLNHKVEELFNLRFQLATGQLTKTSNIKQTRRDIARLKTIINEKPMEMAA
jgi:large subunit ribosomal protein L29